MSRKRIAVVGGGASGLAAALTAAEYADVTVLERGDRVGKKLLQTGNGRCNLFNTGFSPAVLSSGSGDPGDALCALAPAEVMKFFEDIGILLSVRDGGLVYPHTNSAATVLDALRFAARERGVNIRCGFEAIRISRTDGGFEITPMDGEPFFADACVLACGGKAAPKTGSDGSGYALAAMLGHSVTALTPALVPLKCDPGFTAPLKGIRCRAHLTLLADDGSVVCTEDGELQFTDYGISGICVMQLSRRLGRGRTVEINFAAPHTRAQVMRIIENARQNNREVQDLLCGIVPKRVAQQLIRRALGKINLSGGAKNLTDAQLGAVCDACFATRLEVRGTLSWDNAQVTAGGIPLGEVDLRTMRSRCVPWLAITGEMLDCDGACGGYNLGWAWTTGILAGRSFCAEAKNAENN